MDASLFTLPFTPATMAVAALYRALSLEALMKSLKGATAISGMIMFIILGATTFSQILSFSGATEGLVSAILPIVAKQGVDPIWFGVLFLICMQLGLLLPPHGLLLMTMRGVAPPQVTMAHIFQAVVPYVIMSLILLALLLLVPTIATWLPNWLIG